MQEYDVNSYHNQGQDQQGPTVEGTSYRVEDAGPGGPGQPVRKKSHAGAKAVALVLVCALVGGGAGVGGAALYGSMTGGGRGTTTVYQSDTPHAAVNTASVATGQTMTAAEIYAANVNSTVGITVDVVTTNFWGMTTTGAAAGSGFVITQDGYIVTNYHVINVTGAQTITVAMYDGTTYPATLVGYDEEHDLAVLKVDAEGLTPVVLGDSDALSVGEDVVAIGNPLGELTFSLTGGRVSALDRSVTLSTSVTMKLIQTDTAINSGNSGGPLFNQYGQVVGITNAKYSSSSSSEASIDNIGFAIPINQVKSLITQLVETGKVVKPYLGISVKSVTSEVQEYGLPAGAYVAVVEEGGAAAKAGVQVGDVITAVNGEEVSSDSELIAAKNQYQPGDVITLTVYRGGEELELSATLGTTPDTTQETDSAPTETQYSQQEQDQQQNSWPFGFGFGF
jgi:serine protease Do